MNDRLPLTVVEYFAGIGLTRMGLKPCGWKIIYANDISDKKFEMYNDFFPGAKKHYVTGDIFDIEPSKVPSATLAVCSFPCIDLSLAGNMGGVVNGKHSSAFWGFVDILNAQAESAPPIILVENVPGWLLSNKGADFRVTVKALNDAGYSCDVFTLDALRFTPQSRPRIFLVGIKPQVAESQIDAILRRPKSLLSDRLRNSILENQDLFWFANEIPDPPDQLRSGLSLIVEKIDDSDERWWSEKDVKRHLEMMDEAHLKRVMDLKNENEITYRTFFRRRRQGYQRAEVRHDDIAGCLRTAVGGSGKQFLIRLGQGKIRMRTLTVREYARLQGVPDEYPILVSGVQALTGFGDAVCVPAITWVAEKILTPLAMKHQVTELSSV